MFTESAAFYDAIYAAKGKDYAREAQQLHTLIQKQKKSSGNTLLDVACGTGVHIAFLRQHYKVEGLDLDAEMLKIARQRCPEIVFHQADMIDFALGHQFDVITCLFSSIGYVKTLENLRQTVANFAKHLQSGGVLIVEPWFTPEAYHPGTVHATFVDEPELKIARINVSELEDRVAVMKMHYLVGTPEGIQYFTERHEMGLFTHAEYLEAFRVSGLDVFFDSEGLIGRGLYIGIKPLG